MIVDLEGYSRRDGPGQDAAQARLAEALDIAAAVSGLRRGTWFRQDSGDGELAVLPPEEPEPVLVAAFPAALDDALRGIHRRDDLLLRARIAVHHGLAHPAAKGYAGAGVVEVARIVGADPVRRALASVPEARVVLALSQQVFSDVVVQGYSALQPSQFRRVGIADDKFRGTAWLAIPGVDPSRMRVDDPETMTTGAAGVQQSADGPNSTIVQGGRDVTYAPNGTVTNVQGDFKMHDGHIGPRYG